MKNIVSPGDKKTHSFKVAASDFPTFTDSMTHHVCSTYKLAKEIEWSTRMFVLDMLEADEEGFGTYLCITHSGPAFENEEVIISAEVKTMEGNELICIYKARVGDRLVAKGETGQKVLKKTRIKEIFSSIQSQ